MHSTYGSRYKMRKRTFSAPRPCVFVAYTFGTIWLLTFPMAFIDIIACIVACMRPPINHLKMVSIMKWLR